MPLLLLVSYGLALACCYHVVRSGQQMYWLFILLAFPGLGSLAYLLIVMLPDMSGSSAARQLRKTARDTLDPTREYRLARAAFDDTPTVTSRMRLAAAAAASGGYEEAETLYRDAAQGVHADDPALLLGRAQTLVELRRYQEALDLLNQLGELGERGRTAHAALAMGRAFQGLGRNSEAETAYQWAADHMPGLEGMARYAAFLRAVGRGNEAEQLVAEISRRADKARGAFRKEALAWLQVASG
jgi:hypothetical protein